ncbi:MAG: hypothetical protein RBR02_06400 [Desulfuromonadaceae bacterium]|nr:hypothetical protein [Desulfuromonadaceae bacterium]
MNKNDIKKTLGWVFLFLTIGILFLVLFSGIKPRDVWDTFWLELFIASILTITDRAFFVMTTEEKVEPERKALRKEYNKYYDDNVKDINAFEIHLEELDAENKSDYIKQKMGTKTKESHPKLYAKVIKKADKIKPLRITDFQSAQKTRLKYDSRNYYGINKTIYQLLLAIVNIAVSALLAYIMFDKFGATWETFARFMTYTGSLIIVTILTINWTRNKVINTTIEQIERLQIMIDKYVHKRNKGHKFIKQEEENVDGELLQ